MTDESGRKILTALFLISGKRKSCADQRRVKKFWQGEYQIFLMNSKRSGAKNIFYRDAYKNGLAIIQRHVGAESAQDETGPGAF